MVHLDHGDLARYLSFYCKSVSRSRFESVETNLLNSGDPEIWYALCAFCAGWQDSSCVEAVEKKFDVQSQRVAADSNAKYFDGECGTWSRESFMKYYHMCRQLLRDEE